MSGGARQVIEELLVEAAQTYYHGTSKESSGRSILKDKVLRPPASSDLDARYGKGFQRPVDSRVYLTTSLDYAVVYALGGYFMATSVSRETANDPYGYVFVVKGAELTTQPDEDSLGQLPWILSSLDFAAASTFSNHTKLAQELSADPVLASRLERELQRCLPAHTLKKAREGIAAWQSRAGKVLLKSMAPDLLAWAAKHFTNHSASATIPWSEAWRVEKIRSKEIRVDCSNFFEVAERLH